MTFNDGDEVRIIDGTLRGVVGKIVKTDSMPGTESVFYLPTWNPNGSTAHNIPQDHLHRIEA